MALQSLLVPPSPRDAAELTGGAQEAEQSLADTLEDQRKRTHRRKARDGYLRGIPCQLRRRRP